MPAYNPAYFFKVFPCSYNLFIEVFDWWSQVTGENVHLTDATLLWRTYKLIQTSSAPKYGFAGGKI